MKVTINGITYEGTEEEIRRIVENPPGNGGIRINEYPEGPMRIYPWPDYTPTNPNEWPWRNWDGSPRVTCDDGSYRRHATNCAMDGIVSAFLSDQVGI